MKYTYFFAIWMAGILVLCVGCTHDHSDGGQTHGDFVPDTPQLEPFSYTIWTKKSELFVEFPPLIVGQESRFAAHFSEMIDFGPIENGVVDVRLVKGNQEAISNSVSEPSSPGIFRPSITPLEAGKCALEFHLKTQLFADTITLSNVPVYLNEEAAILDHPPAPKGDEISFLKEQAWRTDFAIEQVKRRSIHEVIHTSGEIQPVKGEEKLVAAKSAGIVFFKSLKLQEGREVYSGESLFTISSKGLLKSNLEEKYQVAKARMDKTKSDFERAEKLHADQIIGQKEYERRKMDYQVAGAEYETFNNSYNSDGQSVMASMSGLVKNILVKDGQYVVEGTPLIEITRNRRLLIKAEVSQSDLPKLRMISSANFITPYHKEVQSIEDYNGKLVSYGKVLEEGSSFIPVVFSLDNLHELIPGSFVEMFLLTSSIENELVIPKSALMQDYNLNYVYVQTAGESFEKREVKLGVDDGRYIQIISGISEGEWLVTKGAYQIKMASMSSTIPAHGHEH